MNIYVCMCVYKNTHRYLYTYNNLFNYYICCFLTNFTGRFDNYCN